METKTQTGEKNKRVGKKTRGISAGIVIVVCAIIAVVFYWKVCADGKNFVDNDPNGHPLPGNVYGLIYKAGYVIQMIITVLLTALVLSVERFFALMKAKGRGNLINFVYDVKSDLRKNNIASAEARCAKQKGSVAAIVDAGLKKYKEMETQSLPKEAKIEEIKAEIEEATALELPAMQQNLPVIATISTLGTLLGLLGTVLGMIRAFSAMSTAGAPDAVALSAGISEALINTAFGIATGAIAIITYSYFTGRIDNMTYAVDEMGFALTQAYAETHDK